MGGIAALCGLPKNPPPSSSGGGAPQPPGAIPSGGGAPSGPYCCSYSFIWTFKELY